MRRDLLNRFRLHRGKDREDCSAAHQFEDAVRHERAHFAVVADDDEESVGRAREVGQRRPRRAALFNRRTLAGIDVSRAHGEAAADEMADDGGANPPGTDDANGRQVT